MGSCGYTIFVGTAPHDHTKDYSKKSTTVSSKQAVIAAVQSPSHLDKGAKRLLSEATKFVEMNKKQQTSATRKMIRTKATYTKKIIGSESNGRNWADMHQTMEKYKKENLQDFNQHTAFLLGNWYGYNSEEQYFVCVFSTNNLLLNAYRQLASIGHQAIILGVDTSYRYTKEKHGLMPIVVTNPGQEGKIVACAVCSKEDKEAHKVIFQKVKEEVEAVVNELINKGYTHI